MDYLSSGYTSTARWGYGQDETFTLRWYEAAPGAKVYQGMHAFGSTVWDNELFDDTTQLGEIRPVYRDWSPTGPPLYDGTQPAVSPVTLQHGVDPAVMAVGCDDGSITFQGSGQVYFVPVPRVPSVVCVCTGVISP
jgi:hypothetical protein